MAGAKFSDALWGKKKKMSSQNQIWGYLEYPQA